MITKNRNISWSPDMILFLFFICFQMYTKKKEQSEERANRLQTFYGCSLLALSSPALSFCCKFEKKEIMKKK